jgi:hypothetical protein
MKPLLKNWTVPVALLVLMGLSFGLLISSLGFYWDDWPYLAIQKLQGLEGFRQFFESDRPTTFISYNLLMPLLGTNPVGWQIFTLSLRWLCAVLIWWFVRRIWPGLEELAILSAFFFAVYPVFRQQPIALTYHQLWLEFVFFLLSLVGMVEAVRNPKKYWIWTLAAVAGQLLNFSISEYFLGIEFIRPLILWLAFSTATDDVTGGKRLKKVLLHYVPYLVVLVGYLAWRFVFLDLPGADRNAPVLLAELLETPLPALLKLLQMAVQDFLYIQITSWYVTLQPALFDLQNRFSLFSLAIGLLAAFSAGLYLLVLRKSPDDWQSAHSSQIRSMLFLGFLITAIGPLPAWVTDRQVIVGAWSDRLAVPAMLGASIMLVGLIGWITRNRTRGIILACLLIGLAVGYNLRNANDYRWARIQANRFYWQLSWRAPALTPNTAIFAEAEILPKTGLYSTAAGLNILYSPPLTSGQLPYWFYSLTREFSHRIPELVSGLPLETSFRQFTFQGSSLDGLIVYFQPDEADCMRVLTPNDGDDPALSQIVRQSLPVSDLSRIQANPARASLPASDIFGPEPEHGWCYFFQKASLARQAGDWQTVASLGDKAEAQGFSMENSQSNTPQEWIPFIEGYAHTGRWEKARLITHMALAAEPQMDSYLCRVWNDILSGTSALEETQDGQGLPAELNCQLIVNSRSESLW